MLAPLILRSEDKGGVLEMPLEEEPSPSMEVGRRWLCRARVCTIGEEGEADRTSGFSPDPIFLVVLRSGYPVRRLGRICGVGPVLVRA